MRERKPLNKKLCVVIAAAVTAVAVGCGIWYYLGHNSKEAVYVYPFHYVGMTEYWGDSQESYGPVTTDKIQTVFLTDTQTVTEMLVQTGDAVKKGDLLMTFDTTLSDLQLERKRLEVEKLKLQLEDAQKELKQINSMRPMVIPPQSDSSGAAQGRPIQGEFEISENMQYDGSSAEKAIICWIHGDRNIDDAVFAEVQKKASYYQFMNTPEETEPAEAEEPVETTEQTQPAETTAMAAAETGKAPAPAVNSLKVTLPAAMTQKISAVRTQSAARIFSEGEAGDAPAADPETPPSDSGISYPTAATFHVVFRVTAGNTALGEKITWQGMKVQQNGDGFVFRMESAVIPDHMLEALGGDGDGDIPQIDYGSGYTAAQIAQMRSDQQKKIKELEFSIKMADAEYRIMQTEVSDGNVYASIDGTVMAALTEEEARQTAQPILKVSGGGGFYVEGAVSELEKDKMLPGQEVTVNDWNTGMVYTGTVVSVGDFPKTDSYYSGMGNPNASYYPFRVFVDEEADLQAGNYVSVMYSAGESEHGIYLENPFLRTEQGKSYVYLQGADGKLEKRYVTTGKSLWGSYTEILEGLTAEDLVAFPYGKNVKVGAVTREGDMGNLYG